MLEMKNDINQDMPINILINFTSFLYIFCSSLYNFTHDYRYQGDQTQNNKGQTHQANDNLVWL